MRAVLAVCLLAVMTTGAAARLTAVEPLPPALAANVWTIGVGPAGAMLESDYFRAPQGAFAAKPATPCRLDRRTIVDELRLAYSCR